MCPAFSDKGSSYIPERLPRATSIVYIVLGVTWTMLTNHLERSFSRLVLGFVLVPLGKIVAQEA